MTKRTAAARPARQRLTAAQSLAAVRGRLQAYADRGVFRGYSEQTPRAGRHRFRFSWLGARPMLLDYTPDTGTFLFRGLLPDIAARSSLAGDVTAFVTGRASPRLPLHRRVDRRRARVECVAARGAISVGLVATRNQHDYGANRIINLAHELFLYLQTYQPEYMWKHFDAPQE
ncbi:MAG: hypothetical protein O3A25_00240 [Acidobacteria bacterium]|nr:hypothetical protein [Acidobacteriota bacterium]